MKIGIINNGIGNVGSVESALDFYKYESIFAESPEDIKESDIIILAGVGNFRSAVYKLKDLNLWDTINKEVTINKKPVMGICLGMQLFADISYEDGETKGFGWIKGEVKKIEGKNIRVPHIGWNKIKPLDESLFKGLIYNNFYFMHSYHFIPKDKNLVAAFTHYGDIDIIAAVRKDNIVGVQFHPEKSQGDGLRIFRNFLGEIY